jgi:hypothetical protein
MFVESLGRGLPVERLSRSTIESRSNRVKVVRGVSGKVGALREVLTK